MFHVRVNPILVVFGLLAFYLIISPSTSLANDKLIKGAFDVESGYSVEVRIVDAGATIKFEVSSAETAKWCAAKKSGRGYAMTAAGKDMFSADGGESSSGGGGGC